MGSSIGNILGVDDPSTIEWLSYGELEEILSGVFRVPGANGTSKLRARYKNFHKLGVPSERKPGKGSKKPFTIVQCCEVFLAFQLAEYDISPLVIVELISIMSRNNVLILNQSLEMRKWASVNLIDLFSKELFFSFATGMRLSEDKYLTFEANFLSSRWNTSLVKDFKGKILDESALNHTTLQLKGAHCIINLSNLARRIRANTHIPPTEYSAGYLPGQ